eukprot:TRINITY_DN22775_c0_g1_i1.p1 TRINITY_DN22775_c0_g1~~TRINITY_DN22775_c0_g1_i1.p1  ORF type:complete len:472 (+),score=125.03 TRINITY_DN22775_c0_g1_i1:54-1418(+)
MDRGCCRWPALWVALLVLSAVAAGTAAVRMRVVSGGVRRRSAPPTADQPTGTPPPTHPSEAPTQPAGACGSRAPVSVGSLRLLFSTAVFGRNEKKVGYISAQLNEIAALQRSGVRVRATIDATDDWTDVVRSTAVLNGTVEQRLYSKDVEYALVQRYQEIWPKVVADFDWFLFIEDDMLFTTQHLTMLLQEHRRLNGTGFWPSLIRKELDTAGRPFLPDFSTCMPPQFETLWMIGGEMYVQPSEPYSAHTFVPQSLVRAAMATGQWPPARREWAGCRGRFPGCLDRLFREMNSQLWPPTVYGTWGTASPGPGLRALSSQFAATKVVPICRFSNFTVHHMSDCHIGQGCSAGPVWSTYYVVSLEGSAKCLGSAEDWEFEAGTGRLLDNHSTFPTRMSWDFAGGRVASPDTTGKLGWIGWSRPKPPPAGCPALGWNAPCAASARAKKAGRKTKRRR